MADPRRVISAHMKALIDSLGCFDAAAETLNARWGRGASIGTISKKVHGLLDWTVADVVAFEDALGRYPVTRFLARRMDGAAIGCDASLVQQSGVIAREAGEAVAAILKAEQSSGAGEAAQAAKEIDEAIEALRAARTRIGTDAA